jgi:predicted HicB family RNase H-like nuclease
VSGTFGLLVGLNRKSHIPGDNVRLSPELHQRIAILAKKRRVSLNSFVEKALSDEVALLAR